MSLLAVQILPSNPQTLQNAVGLSMSSPVYRSIILSLYNDVFAVTLLILITTMLYFHTCVSNLMNGS